MTEISHIEIVLGIPGLWPTRTEIITAIVKRTDGLLLTGNILLNTKTNQGYRIDIYERDPALRKAFAIAGRGLFSDQELKTLADHVYTLLSK